MSQDKGGADGQAALVAKQTEDWAVSYSTSCSRRSTSLNEIAPAMGTGLA